MSEGLSFEEMFFADSTLQAINNIISSMARGMDFDDSRFEVKSNRRGGSLVGFSIYLDKVLYIKTDLELLKIFAKNSILEKRVKWASSVKAAGSPKDSSKIEFPNQASGIEFLKSAVHKIICVNSEEEIY